MSILNPDDFFEELVELTPEEQIKALGSQLHDLHRDISNYTDILDAQEKAIILLKNYILENGLKPFWDNLDTKLSRPIKEMTKEEIIEHNKNCSISSLIKNAQLNQDEMNNIIIERYTDPVKQAFIDIFLSGPGKVDKSKVKAYFDAVKNSKSEE